MCLILRRKQSFFESGLSIPSAAHLCELFGYPLQVFQNFVVHLHVDFMLVNFMIHKFIEI